jgi:hypothetical protein
MAGNFKQLQEKMGPVIRSDNQQRVRNELQRMASMNSITAKTLDAHQRSIPRSDGRAEATLRPQALRRRVRDEPLIWGDPKSG